MDEPHTPVAQTSDKGGASGRALAALGGVGAVLGTFAAVAQLIDYAGSAPNALWVTVGLLVAAVPILTAVLYLLFAKDFQRLAALFGLVMSTAVGLTIVFSLGAGDAGAGQDGGEVQTKNAQILEYDGALNCSRVPDEKSDPPRRRECVSITIEHNAVDLDSLDPAWGSPDVELDGRGDIVQSYSGGGLETSYVHRIALLDGATATYLRCRANTVWTTKISLLDMNDLADPAVCVRTDGGRFGLLFIDEIAEDYFKEQHPIEVTAMIWVEPGRDSRD